MGIWVSEIAMTRRFWQQLANLFERCKKEQCYTNGDQSRHILSIAFFDRSRLSRVKL